jgi:MFS family permease
LNSSGAIDVIVPLYQAEISPPKSRGRLVGSHGFLIVVGYGVAGWTGYGSYYETNPEIQWRLPLALQIAAPLIMLLGSWWIPESPRWLLQRHQTEKAMHILSGLHYSPEDVNHTAAIEEADNIRRQFEIDETMPQGITEILKVPSVS